MGFCVYRYFGVLNLAVVFALSGCAAVLDVDDALAITPYRIEESGRIVVETRVNGQGPFDFALDTGSSITAVFDELRNELDLETIPGITITVHGAVASGKFSLLDIDRLEVGREVWTDPRVVSLPGETAAGETVDGILGVDFLRQYAVGFSISDRVVRLYEPGPVSRGSYRGWSAVPLEVKPVGASGATVYFMNIDIDGWKLPAVFDLGAGVNIINWAAARRIGIFLPERGDDEQFSGALGSSSDVAWLDAKEVTTAKIRWRDESFLIADLEIFETLTLRDRPAVILGAGLFTQRDFVIDFVRGRLLVKTAMNEVNESAGSGTAPPALDRYNQIIPH